MAYPSLKTPDQNDWQEEDGVEVDLSAPVLDTREVRLSFLLNDVYGSFSDFRVIPLDKNTVFRKDKAKFSVEEMTK